MGWGGLMWVGFLGMLVFGSRHQWVSFVLMAAVWAFAMGAMDANWHHDERMKDIF